MLVYGPHEDDKKKLGQHRAAQFFINPPLRFLTQRNFPAMILKFSRDFKNTKHVCAHLGYVNHLQSTSPDIVNKSFEDFICAAKIMANIFGQLNLQCYINMHLRSDLAYDHARLVKCLKFMAPNCMLLIEHIPQEPFDNFYKKFSKLRKKGKLGLTFDTAHVFASGKTIEDLVDGIDTISRKKIKGGYIPNLIHLNGNSTAFGSGNDTHCALCSSIDRIFNEELLLKFLIKYSEFPMIIESRKSSSYDDDDKLLKKLTPRVFNRQEGVAGGEKKDFEIGDETPDEKDEDL